MGKGGSRVYAGLTAEQRQGQRREQLLEAGLDVLAERGVAGGTVIEVCRRAGLSQRYFYESFADFGALVQAVHERIVEQGRAAIIGALAEARGDARAHARAAIGAYVRLMTDDPRMGIVSLTDYHGPRRSAMIRGFAELASEQMRAFYGDRTDPERAQLTALIFSGGLSEALVAYLQGTLVIEVDALVDHLADLFEETAGP